MEKIDLTGLGPEEIKFVKEFLDFLRTRAAQQDLQHTAVEYHSWPLGVKGDVTRKEIYDYL